jgi:hypothetical protein
VEWGIPFLLTVDKNRILLFYEEKAAEYWKAVKS